MYKLGIDLGGTNIAAGIVSDGGDILYKYNEKTDTASERTVIDSLAKAVSSLMKTSGIGSDLIETLGVACPGTVNGELGTVEYSANLPLLDTRVSSILAESTGIDA